MVGDSPVEIMTGGVPLPPARRDPRLARRRRARNRLVRALCVAATIVALLLLASILGTLLWRGTGALRWTVFTRMTLPPGSHGGLLNAIIGTLIQTTLGVAIGTPIGLLAGTYLAEYARNSALGNAVRFVSDILLSAPSILIGLFIYELAVRPVGGYSGWAGSLALAVIAVPIVLRTTEDMLTLVPTSLREASMALGAPRYWTVLRIGYPAARDGIMTGILLAVARLAGETAPLLFTSLGNLNWSVRLGAPMSSLPVTIYQYAGSAYADWVELAWAGALLITGGVLFLNIVARLVLRRAAR